eukprot:GHVU01027829.1.p1 GENE.GHVU01027829.1~~GHVU01027829.1.p1  ORF type:complete len:306 (-),score=44.91 GHVU01027829.1:2559-3476(-)
MADYEEESVLRATRTEKGDDGSTTTTTTTTSTQRSRGDGSDGGSTVTKQTKQVSKVGGLGGTSYQINKGPAEETANRLAQTFSNHAYPETSGVISVKTEAWSSRDGMTKRGEKQQTWGGRGGARSAMSAFKQMDSQNAPAGGARPNFLGGGGTGGGRGRGGVGVQRSPSTIKQMLLEWTKCMTKEYENVNITNFSSSWNDGMAFCALIHHFYPDAFEWSSLDPKNRRSNFQLGFDTAEKLADIAPLLDVEDMIRFKNPDWKCVFTYVQSFYRRFRMMDTNAQTPTTPTGTTTPTSPEPQSTEVAQ